MEREGILKQNDDGSFTSEIKPTKPIIPIRLNDTEWEMLEKAKKILEQPKDSTVLKSLAEIGFICITQPETKLILETVFKNKKNNKRAGIVEFEV